MDPAHALARQDRGLGMGPVRGPAGGAAMSGRAIAAMTHAQRMAANREKRRRVLAFLRSEIWTTPGVLCSLLGDRGATSRLVAGLVRDGLVVVEDIPFGRKVVGITLDGQAVAAALVGKEFVARAHEMGRVPLATLEHRCDLQRLRIACAKAGWGGWTYPDRVPVSKKAGKDAHRPDALATTPDGVRVALEVERTPKTAKRYRFILGRHLDAIRRGEYSCVLYTCPDAARVKGVRAIIHGLGHAVVGGVDKKLTEADLDHFDFLSYDDTPNWQPKEH